MIFPIGDDNVKGGAYPFFSYLFLALNIVIFVYSLSSLHDFVYKWGANPCQIIEGQNLSTIITSMFMHGGPMHLIGNMLFLWIFADNIESTIGNVKFLLFYIAGGVFAAFTHILISGPGACTIEGGGIPMVGASGAIAAVMGAYLVMFPMSRIKMLFIITIFRIPAFILLGLWIIEQVISGLSDIRIFNDPEEGGVAFWAHIGGFVFGVLLGLFFKNRNPKLQLVQTGEKTREYRTVDIPATRYNNRLNRKS